MNRPALISLLVVALLAGCDSGNSDRAGGEKPVKAKVLVMANANFDPGELQAFDKAVRHTPTAASGSSGATSTRRGVPATRRSM
jgi:hypothetical protein